MTIPTLDWQVVSELLSKYTLGYVVYVLISLHIAYMYFLSIAGQISRDAPLLVHYKKNFENHLRQFGESRFRTAPDPYSILIRINDVFQVCRECFTICFIGASGLSNSLCYIENYTREAIFVEEDFLIIWNLTNCAVVYVSDSLVQAGMEAGKLA